jgi:hypothetical protein
VGLRLLHLVTADPKRTPTLVAFAKPDYFVSTNAADCSATAAVIECPPSFGQDAWMHGTLSPEINLARSGRLQQRSVLTPSPERTSAQMSASPDRWGFVEQAGLNLAGMPLDFWMLGLLAVLAVGSYLYVAGLRRLP